MSKSNAAQRREAQKKLPLVVQKMLANSRVGAHGQAAATEEFQLNYLANRREAIQKQKPFRDALAVLHASNPFQEVEYGNAIFTYVPTELAKKIADLCAEWKVPVQEELQGKGWSSMRYKYVDGKPLGQGWCAPSPDHKAFMSFVQYEQLRATEEQDTNMRALLTQLALDVGVVDVSNAG